MVEVIDAARGKWKSILPLAGIDSKYLTGHHGPCPMCGGRDRYRFDDREGKGTWICSKCGPGDGMDLITKMTGMSFRAAAEKVEDIIGVHKPRAERAKEKKDPTRYLRRVYRQTQPLSAMSEAVEYLEKRGVRNWMDVTDDMRSCSSLPLFEQGKKVGEYPAIIGVVRGADGKGVNIHRTWLTPDGPLRKLGPGGMPPGSACRVMAPGRHMGIGEGIETSLSWALITKLPAWAALTAGALEKWVPPKGTEKITILADNDASFTGQASAYALARRLVSKGYDVEVAAPANVGEDWNDVLKSGRAQ